MSRTLPVSIEEAQPGERPETLSAEHLVELYRQMTRIRAFEEEAIEAFKARLIPGTTHVCIGQEAIKVGVADAVGRNGLFLASYRGHGEALSKNVDVVSLFAELMCRETGMCHGKGGSMHLSEPSLGLVSTNAIVAAHIPIAGGVALSAKLRKTGEIVVCVFGDGAACEGEFFETLNMAALWKVPLIFVCENNGKAISVPTERSQATPDISDRARGVGMAVEIVDGNDVIAVRDAALRAADHTGQGRGPYFLECKTVRWERHSGFSSGGSEDPAVARAAWQSVDPLKRYRKCLLGWQVATAKALDELDQGTRDEMAAARRQAEEGARPGPESVYEHIFAPSKAIAGVTPPSRSTA